MDYGFVAYIDESGDPGIRRVSKYGSEGSSEWLIVGCILIRAEREAQIVQWAHEARELLELRQRQDIHYKDMSPKRKAAICGHIAAQPLRAFVLASNKKKWRDTPTNGPQRCDLSNGSTIGAFDCCWSE